MANTGPVGTILFDWCSILHAVRSKPSRLLTLGYNTAVLGLLPYLMRIPNFINMDGLEWKRPKWNCVQRAWLWLNERAAIFLGDHLIADHPEIERRLLRWAAQSRITMIPYGAWRNGAQNMHCLSQYGVAPHKFSAVIARPEPENSLLEIVRAFSRRKRGTKLLVLGRFDLATNAYHRSVVNCASDEVIFPGAIYDSALVRGIRAECLLYIHGHQVGGTNPSLVESLGVGAAVLAHDNLFNRWVAGEGASYFGSEDELASRLDDLLDDTNELARMRATSLKRFQERFRWERVLAEYESLLLPLDISSGKKECSEPSDAFSAV
ncbi:glycosyltransferase involved in cell wall biosynthesis [Rhizomicrobium electricum]|nr:glycosyltransferase involved in cell wall biosynthesis [Rhizomicrobium electricum]